MNNNATPLETLFVKVEDYSKTTMELFKLNAIDKSADIASSLAVRLAIFFGLALFIFSISIGLGLWIGEFLGKSYYGFFVIGGGYLLITLIIYVCRNQLIKTPVSNSIITQMQKTNLV